MTPPSLFLRQPGHSFPPWVKAATVELLLLCFIYLFLFFLFNTEGKEKLTTEHQNLGHLAIPQLRFEFVSFLPVAYNREYI